MKYLTRGTGVVEQVDKSNIINYNESYLEKYDKIKDLCYNMAYLRYGIASRVKFNSVFDFGYGTGEFLEVCAKANKSCYGYDPINRKIKDVYTECNPSSPINNHYDLVTFFDSLEHMKDIDFIKNIKCNYVIVSVPCMPNEGFNNWLHKRPNEHLYHFNVSSLKNHFESKGYKCLSIGNPEDVIRQSELKPNIITGIFEKVL